MHFYCSRLNGNKICWPVEVIRTGTDGWRHVRGLAGRFKGRTFTVVGSEISSYVPKGYKLAPGAKAFLPKISTEYTSTKKLHSQTYKLLSGAQSSGSIPVAIAQRLLKKVEALAFTLQPRTPFDPAWKDYGKDVEEAEYQIRQKNGTYAVGQLHSALGMIEGAASREGGSRFSFQVHGQHGRDPFFGKKLGGRAKSRLSEGRAKQKFDRLYTGFKNEGASATTAYRKAIQMMPRHHTPEAQKAWLEDLAEYEKHAYLINKKDEFHLSLRDPKRDPIIRKVGKKFVLFSIKTGKRLGTHPTRAAALRQERAIHVAKRDPSTKRKSFVIETRNKSMSWTPMTWYMVRARYSIPGLNGLMKFKTNAEAEEGIRLLRSFGDDWAAAEYRVV